MEVVFASREAGDFELAALEDPSAGDSDLRKAAITFGNDVFAWGIKSGDETAAAASEGIDARAL